MGLEYISQPQVFLAPITAVNGVQGINNPYPLLTTYQSWVSTGTVNTSAFPIPGSWTMLDASGSFIVTVGNVIQSPTDYTIDRNNRILTFSSIITAGVEVGVTQLATASPSATSFDSVQSTSGTFVELSAFNIRVQNLTAFGDFTRFDTLLILTSAMSITNAGTGPALLVNQTGAQPIANFQDDGTSALFVADGGNIGLGTTTPNSRLTVIGDISSSRVATLDKGIVAGTGLSGASIAVAAATYGFTDPNLAVATFIANTSSFSQVYNQNQYPGVSSSADIVAVNDVGGFIDMGINSSKYNGSYSPTFTVAASGDAYLYNFTTGPGLSGNMAIGTGTSTGDLILFTGGTLNTNEKLRIKAGGNVGIGTTTPNQLLTVAGNISATGDVFSNNSLLSFGGANTTTASPGQIFYGTNSDIVLDANSRYEIIFDLYFSKTALATVTYALSGNTTFANIAANYIQQPNGGLNGNTTITGAGVVGQTAAFIALPVTGSLAVGNNYATIKAVVETNAANRLNLSVWGGAAGTITPLRGSYWVKRRIN